MRAVVLKGFGGLEMLEERVLPVPEPGPGEVLVRNLAVAVNPVDAKIRAAGRWAGVEPPFVLGYDAAGDLAIVFSVLSFALLADHARELFDRTSAGGRRGS